MKRIALILAILAIGISLSAQQVVSSGGGYAENSGTGISLSWTIGELAIATLSSGDIVLTQGFQQPIIEVTSIDEIPLSEIWYKAFPNPTSELLIIESMEFEEDVMIQMYDMQGKMIYQKKMLKTEIKKEIGMSEYSSGQYILKIFDTKGKAIQSFKIIKN